MEKLKASETWSHESSAADKTEGDRAYMTTTTTTAATQKTQAPFDLSPSTASLGCTRSCMHLSNLTSTAHNNASWRAGVYATHASLLRRYHQLEVHQRMLNQTKKDDQHRTPAAADDVSASPQGSEQTSKLVTNRRS